MDVLLLLAAIGVLQYIGLQIYIGLMIGRNENSFNISAAFGGFNTGIAVYGTSGSLAFISFAYILYKIFRNRR
jgi:hypothetical protein